jgi:hypothetical protein
LVQAPSRGGVVTAAERQRVRLVISRGGRPDLAGNALLACGSDTADHWRADPQVRELNEAAAAVMSAMSIEQRRDPSV